MNNHLVLASLTSPPSSLHPHRLKVQQGLLVDFAAFPQKFIDLLELCITESSKEKPKYVQVQTTCTGGAIWHVFIHMHTSLLVNVHVLRLSFPF